MASTPSCKRGPPLPLPLPPQPKAKLPHGLVGGGGRAQGGSPGHLAMPGVPGASSGPPSDGGAKAAGHGHPPKKPLPRQVEILRRESGAGNSGAVAGGGPDCSGSEGTETNKSWREGDEAMEEEEEWALEEEEAENPLRQAAVLAAEEVIQRRIRHIRKLMKLYRSQYWVLLEEVRAKHRKFYLRHGRGGWREGGELEPLAGGVLERAWGRPEPHAPDKPANATLHCAAAGPCLAKPLALSVFCLDHILLEPRQKLYKPCSYATRSGGSSSTQCGRPVLCSVQPLLCPEHQQAAQKHALRALKRSAKMAGLGLAAAAEVSPGTTKGGPKLHLIINEYVREIQSKRRRLALQEAAQAARMPAATPGTAGPRGPSGCVSEEGQTERASGSGTPAEKPGLGTADMREASGGARSAQGGSGDGGSGGGLPRGGCGEEGKAAQGVEGVSASASSKLLGGTGGKSLLPRSGAGEGGRAEPAGDARFSKQTNLAGSNAVNGNAPAGTGQKGKPSANQGRTGGSSGVPVSRSGSTPVGTTGIPGPLTEPGGGSTPGPAPALPNRTAPGVTSVAGQATGRGDGRTLYSGTSGQVASAPNLAGKRSRPLSFAGSASGQAAGSSTSWLKGGPKQGLPAHGFGSAPAVKIERTSPLSGGGSGGAPQVMAPSANHVAGAAHSGRDLGGAAQQGTASGEGGQGQGRGPAGASPTVRLNGGSAPQTAMWRHPTGQPGQARGPAGGGQAGFAGRGMSAMGAPQSSMTSSSLAAAGAQTFGLLSSAGGTGVGGSEGRPGSAFGTSAAPGGQAGQSGPMGSSGTPPAASTPPLSLAASRLPSSGPLPRPPPPPAQFSSTAQSPTPGISPPPPGSDAQPSSLAQRRTGTGLAQQGPTEGGGNSGLAGPAGAEPGWHGDSHWGWPAGQEQRPEGSLEGDHKLSESRDGGPEAWPKSQVSPGEPWAAAGELAQGKALQAGAAGGGPQGDQAGGASWQYSGQGGYAAPGDHVDGAAGGTNLGTSGSGAGDGSTVVGVPQHGPGSQGNMGLAQGWPYHPPGYSYPGYHPYGSYAAPMAAPPQGGSMGYGYYDPWGPMHGDRNGGGTYMQTPQQAQQQVGTAGQYDSTTQAMPGVPYANPAQHMASGHYGPNGWQVQPGQPGGSGQVASGQPFPCGQAQSSGQAAGQSAGNDSGGRQGQGATQFSAAATQQDASREHSASPQPGSGFQGFGSGQYSSMQGQPMQHWPGGGQPVYPFVATPGVASGQPMSSSQGPANGMQASGMYAGHMGMYGTGQSLHGSGGQPYSMGQMAVPGSPGRGQQEGRGRSEHKDGSRNVSEQDTNNEVVPPGTE